jgi:enamine deaminase RidA (YjgF/YER057c/UK114 family)
VERRTVDAQSSFATRVGYSRGVRVGNHVFIAGTAPIMADGTRPPDDPYKQARRCLEIIVEALRELGAEPEHVVRTRIYLTAGDDIREVGRAHGEVFREVKPVTTAIVVRELLDPDWMVEIEAEAIVP